MKQLQILIIFFLSTKLVTAQHSYIPLVNSGKYWFYNTYDGNDIPNQVNSYVIWFNSDSIISGKKYLRVFSSPLKGNHPCQFPPCFTPFTPYEFQGKELLGFITEDTLLKKVYFLPKHQFNENCLLTESELYNFGLNIGDTISECHKTQMGKNWTGSQNFGIIEASELADLYGKERKILNFTAPATNFGMLSLGPMQLIEGVGMNYYEPFSYALNTIFSGFCEGTIEDCNISTSLSVINKNDFWISPNPTPTIVKINGINKIQKIELIDMNGRRLEASQNNNELDLSNLPQGFYIILLTDYTNNRYYKQIVKI
jgi:hypothetical protein